MGVHRRSGLREVAYTITVFVAVANHFVTELTPVMVAVTHVAIAAAIAQVMHHIPVVAFADIVQIARAQMRICRRHRLSATRAGRQRIGAVSTAALAITTAVLDAAKAYKLAANGAGRVIRTVAPEIITDGTLGMLISLVAVFAGVVAVPTGRQVTVDIRHITCAARTVNGLWRRLRRRRGCRSRLWRRCGSGLGRGCGSRLRSRCGSGYRIL